MKTAELKMHLQIDDAFRRKLNSNSFLRDAAGPTRNLSLLCYELASRKFLERAITPFNTKGKVERIPKNV